VKTFQEIRNVNEAQKYPTWVKGSSIFLALKVRNLSLQIAQTKDVDKKINLLADQNRMLAYLVTMGIGVDTKDKALMRRFSKRQ
jgi:hypothetical protein